MLRFVHWYFADAIKKKRTAYMRKKLHLKYH